MKPFADFSWFKRGLDAAAVSVGARLTNFEAAFRDCRISVSCPCFTDFFLSRPPVFNNFPSWKKNRAENYKFWPLGEGANETWPEVDKLLLTYFHSASFTFRPYLEQLFFPLWSVSAVTQSRSLGLSIVDRITEWRWRYYNDQRVDSWTPFLT